MTKPVIETSFSDVVMRVIEIEDGYRLEWDDNIANYFREDYESLSTAVARLAVLIACGEGEWEPTFTRDASQHAKHFDALITEEMTR